MLREALHKLYWPENEVKMPNTFVPLFITVLFPRVKSVPPTCASPIEFPVIVEAETYPVSNTRKPSQ
jgi:hypothetical protein